MRTSQKLLWGAFPLPRSSFLAQTRQKPICQLQNWLKVLGPLCGNPQLTHGTQGETGKDSHHSAEFQKPAPSRTNRCGGAQENQRLDPTPAVFPGSDHSSGLAVHCRQLETLWTSYALHSFSVLVFEPTETLPKPKDAIQSFGKFQTSIPRRLSLQSQGLPLIRADQNLGQSL